MLAGMSRARLKGQARARLLGNYGNAAGGLFLIYLIGFVFIMTLSFGTGFAEMFFLGLGGPDSRLPALAASVVLLVGGWILYFGAVQIFMAGYTRLVYRVVTEGESNLNDLTYALNRRMFRFIGLSLLMLLLSLVITILFLILAALLSLVYPYSRLGIHLLFWAFWLIFLILTVPFLCWYWMVFISLAEEPNRTVKEAMKLAKDILKGNLWRTIKFELSFFGMYALGYLSFGLGYLWVMPYSLASNILFYMQLKEEHFGTAQPVPEQQEVWYPPEQAPEYPEQTDTW